MKYLIIALRHENASTQDRLYYLENIRKCEKFFKLRPMQSNLRRGSAR